MKINSRARLLCDVRTIIIDSHNFHEIFQCSTLIWKFRPIYFYHKKIHWWKGDNIIQLYVSITEFKSIQKKSLFFFLCSFVLLLYMFPQYNHHVRERCKSLLTIMTYNYIYIISVYNLTSHVQLQTPLFINLPTKITLNFHFPCVYDNKTCDQTSVVHW